MQTVYSRPSPDLDYYKEGMVIPIKVSGTGMTQPKRLHLMGRWVVRKNVTTYGNTPSGDDIERDDRIYFDPYVASTALFQNMTHTIYNFGQVPEATDKALLQAFLGRAKNIRSEIGAGLRDSSKQMAPDHINTTVRLIPQVTTPANAQKGDGTPFDIPVPSVIDMAFDSKGRPSGIPFNLFPVHEINATVPSVKKFLYGEDVDSSVHVWFQLVSFKYDVEASTGEIPFVRIYNQFTGLANSLKPTIQVNSNLVADSMFMGFIPANEVGTYTDNQYRMARLPDWQRASFTINGGETFGYILNTEADLLYNAQMAINGNTGNTSMNMEMLQRGDTTSDGFIIGAKFARPVDLKTSTAGVMLECGTNGPNNTSKKYIARGFVGGFMQLAPRMKKTKANK